MMQLLDNQYFIGRLRIEDLCKKFGTPLYAYDLSILEDRIKKLQNMASQVKSEVKLYYSVKANYNPHLIKILIANGFGIDAVSIEEVKLGLFCGAAKEDVMYTESNMTDAEMHESHKLGVLINIGSLSRLKKFGENFPSGEVSVRFNPNIGAASHLTNITGGPDSKFGIPYEKVDKVLNIIGKYSLKLRGIHEHIGSGWLGIEEPLIAVDVILDIAKKIPCLEFVDFGGGFGVPYKPDQKPLDFVSLGKELNRKIDEFQKQNNRKLKFIFEPGRYPVAEAGHLLTRVTTLKESQNGQVFAGTDTGMNQLVRVAMYGSYHPIINISNPDGLKQKYNICGNVCESADFFAKNRELNEIREGDVLCIDIAGAYGMSMASNYQFRPLPAEVLVTSEEVKLIKPRETFENLVSRFGF